MEHQNDDFANLSVAERLAGERENAKEVFETEFKAVGYLLAANGAGLVGCLSVVKDYSSNSQLQGIGVLIVAFAVGFLFAILSFMTAQQHRAAVMGIFLGEMPKASIKSIVWRAQLPQMFSGLALMVAVILIIFKFGKL